MAGLVPPYILFWQQLGSSAIGVNTRLQNCTWCQAFPHMVPLNVQSSGVVTVVPAVGSHTGSTQPPRRLRAVTAALACGCGGYAAADVERLAELTAEDAGEMVNADADESQHQQQSTDQSAADDAACGYEAWLLALHPGQNRFRITLPDQQAQQQQQQQQHTFAGGRAGNDSSGVGTEGSEYSLTVVRLADPSNAELQSITGKQRPRERCNGTCHKHLACTASTRCYSCSVTPGALHWRAHVYSWLLHCDLYSAAAKLSGETLVLCGPPAEDGSRLRAALDCDAAVQLPQCTRPCKPGALVRQAGFAHNATGTFIGHDSPMACILALNQMKGHCTAEVHACSLRHISFIFALVHFCRAAAGA